MNSLITFLEGVLSFLSPCMLPLLPVYLGYFAGDPRRRQPPLPRILAFILGFTISFMLLGLLFSAIGQLLARYQAVVNLVCGGLMVLFGLSCLGFIHLPGPHPGGKQIAISGAASAFVFGLIYPINLTPCVGAFLGSALALATASGSVGAGVTLLLVYSLGLGLPFLLSALIFSRLDTIFAGIKAHYALVERISGGLLILVGVLIMTGVFSRFLGLFT